MLFTKIWTAVLAVLATACLAGMYLLSTASSGGFTEADKTAVRAVTEAGMAALASDINSSPVSLAPSLLTDTRLKDALDPKPPDPRKLPQDDLEPPSLEDVFIEVANESLLDEHPLLSVALIDKDGKLLARTGFSPELFEELAKMPALSSALASEDADLFSATLGDKLHAVKLSRPVAETQARRLIAIQAVELGGGSFFRRVVGTGNPSGLIRDGKLVGDPIGGAKAEDLAAWVAANVDNVPPEGASDVFEVGEGGDKRIGAAARVPGPAGKGKDATYFVVLSSHTLASTQVDMASGLSKALDEGGLGKLNWPLVAGLLVISLVLTFYLPHLEFTTPMKRLDGELTAIIEGRKHQIDHDTYGGLFSTVGRRMQTALEAMRVTWETDLVDSDGELDDEGSGRRARATRSVRVTRATSTRPKRTRGNKKVTGSHAAVDESSTDAGPSSSEVEAIDLPDAPSETEPKVAARAPASMAKAAAPPPAPVPFHDDAASAPLSDDDDAISLADTTGGSDREAYYQRIYQEFVETKTACGEPVDGFTYEKFAKKLRKQSDDLLGRGDVKDVEFSVYVKDGKAALRAKVIKA